MRVHRPTAQELKAEIAERRKAIAAGQDENQVSGSKRNSSNLFETFVPSIYKTDRFQPISTTTSSFMSGEEDAPRKRIRDLIAALDSSAFSLNNGENSLVQEQQNQQQQRHETDTSTHLALDLLSVGAPLPDSLVVKWKIEIEANFDLRPLVQSSNRGRIDSSSSLTDLENWRRDQKSWVYPESPLSVALSSSGLSSAAISEALSNNDCWIMPPPEDVDVISTIKRRRLRWQAAMFSAVDQIISPDETMDAFYVLGSANEEAGDRDSSSDNRNSFEGIISSKCLTVSAVFFKTKSSTEKGKDKGKESPSKHQHHTQYKSKGVTATAATSRSGAASSKGSEKCEVACLLTGVRKVLLDRLVEMGAKPQLLLPIDELDTTEEQRRRNMRQSIGSAGMRDYKTAGRTVYISGTAACRCAADFIVETVFASTLRAGKVLLDVPKLFSKHSFENAVNMSLHTAMIKCQTNFSLLAKATSATATSVTSAAVKAAAVTQSSLLLVESSAPSSSSSSSNRVDPTTQLGKRKSSIDSIGTEVVGNNNSDNDISRKRNGNSKHRLPKETHRVLLTGLIPQGSLMSLAKALQSLAHEQSTSTTTARSIVPPEEKGEKGEEEEEEDVVSIMPETTSTSSSSSSVSAPRLTATLQGLDALMHRSATFHMMKSNASASGGRQDTNNNSSNSAATSMSSTSTGGGVSSLRAAAGGGGGGGAGKTALKVPMMFVTVPVQATTQQDSTSRAAAIRNRDTETAGGGGGGGFEWIDQQRAGSEPFFVIRVFSAYQTAAFAYAGHCSEKSLFSAIRRPPTVAAATRKKQQQQRKTEFRGDQEVYTLRGAGTMTEIRWSSSMDASTPDVSMVRKDHLTKLKPVDNNKPKNKPKFGLQAASSMSNSGPASSTNKKGAAVSGATVSVSAMSPTAIVEEEEEEAKVEVILGEAPEIMGLQEYKLVNSLDAADKGVVLAPMKVHGKYADVT